MVTCERCRRKFVSFAALSQHFDTKHNNARRPPELERGLAAEKELDEYKVTAHYVRGPSKIKIGAFLLILIVAAGVIGYVALTPREQTVGSALGPGAIAPDFTLADVNGGTFTLSSYKGKANVLLFFNEGLSCQPCLRQMTDLDQVNGQFVGLDVTVVSITTDPLSLLTEWANSNGPHYGKVLSDQNLAVSKVYDVLGPDTSMMPGSKPGHTFILVDSSGVIKWRHDYGPSIMYTPVEGIVAAVKSALGA